MQGLGGDLVRWIRILERPVSKIVLLVEQECVQFPDEEAQKE